LKRPSEGSEQTVLVSIKLLLGAKKVSNFKEGLQAGVNAIFRFWNFPLKSTIKPFKRHKNCAVYLLNRAFAASNSKRTAKIARFTVLVAFAAFQSS
jgi:hypothetical protein